ncbi:MAG: phage portal protein [Chloroflexi bacterium]|nr:phage portal protein [Chloroflexota bacterium]
MNINQLSRMDSDRLASYRRNLDIYNGLQWTESRQVRRRQRQLTFNYIKTFVDKVTSYLMSGFSFAIDPVENSAESIKKAQLAEESIRDVYDFNNLQQLDFDTELDAAILGDGCYKVTWDAEENHVRVSAPDVQGIYAWWTGDDVSRIWQVVSRYHLSADEIEMLYGYSARNGKEATVIEVWTGAAFELWIDNTLFDFPT